MILYALVTLALASTGTAAVCLYYDPNFNP